MGQEYGAWSRSIMVGVTIYDVIARYGAWSKSMEHGAEVWSMRQEHGV
ncbi:Hypothetical protein DEACI_1229 [Acididesulfobacillus acetoxydans]|uniref:Uncharacterized protein n=1 Tax=Acididesulfobacillus acetoxydans TaxID=1561005 RepID=A0A8S0XAZ4_9FIRM|nr:Hypothetical protein DEACI_1229 [Acididesulfobacillus acetoxydans]CEJ06710.1 Hypothetical protein DEACI_1160 [Acididesulfobacillus acetoxydans]